MNPNEDEYTRLNVFQFFLVCARAKAQMACWAGMRMSDKHRLGAERGKKRDTQKYSENSMKFIDDEINTQESCSSSWREFFEVSLATPLSYHIPRQGSERISRSLLLPSNLLHSSSLALPLLFMRPTVRRDARTDWMRQTKAQRVRGDPRPKAKANQHFFFDWFPKLCWDSEIELNCDLLGHIHSRSRQHTPGDDGDCLARLALASVLWKREKWIFFCARNWIFQVSALADSQNNSQRFIRFLFLAFCS